MMKKICAWMCLALAGCLFGGSGSTQQSEPEAVLAERSAEEPVILDYGDDRAFEKQLNAGKNLFKMTAPYDYRLKHETECIKDIISKL